jgi:hypothetical protein
VIAEGDELLGTEWDHAPCVCGERFALGDHILCGYCRPECGHPIHVSCFLEMARSRLWDREREHRHSGGTRHSLMDETLPEELDGRALGEVQELANRANEDLPSENECAFVRCPYCRGRPRGLFVPNEPAGVRGEILVQLEHLAGSQWGTDYDVPARWAPLRFREKKGDSLFLDLIAALSGMAANGSGTVCELSEVIGLLGSEAPPANDRLRNPASDELLCLLHGVKKPTRELAVLACLTGFN